MNVLGVDPGASGGLVVVDDLQLVAVEKMPPTEADLLEVLGELGGVVNKAYLEKVHAMPQQGVSSTFKFGQHYGSLKMALTAAKIPYEEVSPSMWQRTLGCLSKGDKNVTKRKAQELYPSHKWTHATADAALIALYGWRKERGG